ncbi:class I SAM-dependent methyltransferase [Gracilibacillus kekensis]|uniref:Trans-aconitate methyltransferase n=1 Tax=Gracilibacillus kekensis TaxID=1027249 RepID=A0A1M7QZK6_9BACI|nr:class I SAM-dependent methyltransferase [Gracilibacillus kekensis]SHN37657.1 Trans-aconitate methyltransferase [Gracilibacillus kekensis]
MVDEWQSNLYDDKHHFVSKYGKGILELLEPIKDEKILDVGCGTGDLAAEISKSGAIVRGIDKSESMIQTAKSKYSHLNFDTVDILKMNFNEEFDAIFSNAALHWLLQPKEGLQKIYQSLRKGGRFVAEFGGKNNVLEIRNALQEAYNDLFRDYPPLKNPWYFPSIAEYTTLMEEVGFTVHYARYYSRPTPLEGADGLANWLSMFGEGMLKHLQTDEKRRLIENVEKRLKSTLYVNHQWIADYCRIQVIGNK